MARHGQALGPRTGIPPEMATPLSIIALIWGGIAIVLLAWLLGGVAAFLSGNGWQLAPLEFESIAAAFSENPEPVWGASQAWLFGVWIAAFFVLLIILGVVLGLRSSRPASDDPLRSLARPADVAALTPKRAAARARQLLPSLAQRDKLEPAECGLALGTLLPNGPVLRASWEDVGLAIMAPRSGKTTALSVPMVLDAPGAVVATSNKSDLLSATAAIRSERGEVWCFDPQGVAVFPRRFTWNPLAGIASVQEANRLARQFAQEVKGPGKGGGDFWVSAAEDLLTGLILAAAVDGRDLRSVYEWLNDSAKQTPRQLLLAHGFGAVGAALEGRQQGAVETREGIYETARTAAQCLRDPTIMEWVVPDPALPAFSADEFVTGTDSLFLLSKEGGGSAAPLVAAFVDRVIRAATAEAEADAGRLDPPLVLILDEAANIAKIDDLPDLYSHLGSRSIVPFCVLQSAEQGQRVWGEDGFATLWGAATVKVLGAGLDSARLAEDISKMVGEHDVAVRSTSHGRDSSTSTSLRQQRILPPDAVRALPRGQALVLATGARPAMVKLDPWYESDRAKAISKANDASEQAIRERARTRRTKEHERV